jgi:hypothetical protein
MKTKLVLTFSLLLIGIQVQAAKECTFDGLKLYSYSASPDRNISFEYDNSGNVLGPKSTNKLLISSCKEAAMQRKSLLVALGPVEYDTNVTRDSSDYSKETTQGNCHLENNPFKTIQNFPEILENNRKKLKFIDNCVDIHISSASVEPLRYNENQVSCKISKISDQEILARGGRCLINIAPDSVFEIGYSIRKECQNLDYLKSLGLNPMEVITRAMIFTADTSNPNDLQKVFIGQTLVRFQVEPSSIQGPLSEDLNGSGLPVYFRDYYLPEVFFGPLKINSIRGIPNLSSSLVVDNRCKKLCSDGVCTSACDYSNPFVGLFSLNRIEKNGKKSFLKEWFDGTAIPANFQGFVPLRERRIDEFKDSKDGDKFLLEVSLSDPKYEYGRFKNSIKGFLAPIPGIPTSDLYTSLNSGLTGFQDTGSIATLPNINGIGNFTGSNTIGGMNSINTMSNFSDWPAEYENICSFDGQRCQKMSSKPFLIFNITFQIKIEGENYLIQNLKIERKSNLIENSIKTETQIPFEKCGSQ